MFIKSNGIEHKLAAPNHRATNGLAEQYIKPLKKAIKDIQKLLYGNVISI